MFKFRSYVLAFCLISGFSLAFVAPVAGQKKKAAVLPTIDKKSLPVVLIHGIGGADLERKKDPNERGLMRDGFPNDVLKSRLGDPQNLQFDDAGAPWGKVSGLIKAVGLYDVPRARDMTDLSKFLRRQGYQKDANLFEFYYDFRFSVPQTAALLKDFIERIKSETKFDRVDIVAHSMGGMIAKQYLLGEESAKSVRTVIFVGTPHLGAPKALKALRYGDDLEAPLLIDQCKLKRAVHNLPSMFNLLPGERYFAVSGGGYFTDDADNDGDGVRGLLDYKQTLFNLANGKERRCLLRPRVDAAPYDRLSASLVENNVAKFRAAQDNWKKPDNVVVYAIAGYGMPTVKALRETADELFLTYTTEGDGTVPLVSAETIEADKIYYVNVRALKTEHSTMIGNSAIHLQVFNLLQKGAGDYAAGISTVRPGRQEFSENSISDARFN